MIMDLRSENSLLALEVLSVIMRATVVIDGRLGTTCHLRFAFRVRFNGSRLFRSSAGPRLA